MKHRQEQKALMMLLGTLVFLVVGCVAYFLLVNKQDSSLVAEQPVWAGHTSGDSSSSSATTGSSAAQPDGQKSPASFFFDPNTADSATLVAVGLSPYQARNVLRYRQKGGQYHRPEDFKRLYGLTVSQWEHLEPLIRIGREYSYLADVEDVSPSYPHGDYSRGSYSRGDYSRGGYSRGGDSRGNGESEGRPEEGRTAAARGDSLLHSTHPFRSNSAVKKIQKGEYIDLSHCDTSELKRVPGIGNYYAKRIADYAERLGGFVSLDQLNDDELSFLPTDIDQYLTVKGGSVRKLRINQLSTRELARHPYISYAQAREITNRIRVSGPFRSWDELLFLSEFSVADRRRLEPYIEF